MAALTRASLWDLDPARYVAHSLHKDERAWAESNCYVDLWIELLHACGFEPLASLAFTLSIDFEGDQWTFFKQPLGDLAALYGVDVQELNVWWSLPKHIVEQVARKRPVVVEVDSFYLPDTHGVAYKIEHTKTTIAVETIDLDAGRLHYFHNAGYYALDGADFRGLFRLDEPNGSESVSLPPYVEFVKLDARKRCDADELRRGAVEQLRAHVSKRPRTNPFSPFASHFEADLAWLRTEPILAFHRYAFATLRQVGPSFELAAFFLRWLERAGEADLEPAAADFEAIATASKALLFKIARAVNAKKPLDAAPVIAAMGASWESGMGRLASRYGA